MMITPILKKRCREKLAIQPPGSAAQTLKNVCDGRKPFGFSTIANGFFAGRVYGRMWNDCWIGVPPPAHTHTVAIDDRASVGIFHCHEQRPSGPEVW